MFWALNSDRPHQNRFASLRLNLLLRALTRALKLAPSYASTLNAAYYLVTNGKQLKLFKRGVESDTRLLSCDSNKFVDVWQTLNEEIGNKD